MMHISLTITNVLQVAFIIIMLAPLPILLLSSPFQYITERIANKKYYQIIKKHYEDPSTVSAEQLSDIFPDKKLEELHQIVFTLSEARSNKE